MSDVARDTSSEKCPPPYRPQRGLPGTTPSHEHSSRGVLLFRGPHESESPKWPNRTFEDFLVGRRV